MTFLYPGTGTQVPPSNDNPGDKEKPHLHLLLHSHFAFTILHSQLQN